MADTRTRLLEAAEQAVREHGVEGFSYADLSSEVGIRKASIHYHFPAKADLLAALVARYRGHILTQLARIESTSRTAAAAIMAFLDLYRRALGNCTSLCLCVACAVNPQALDERVQAEISQFRRTVLAWLEARFTAAMSDASVALIQGSDQEAAGALAVAEGGQIAARLAGELSSYDQAVASLRCRLS